MQWPEPPGIHFIISVIQVVVKKTCQFALQHTYQREHKVAMIGVDPSQESSHIAVRMSDPPNPILCCATRCGIVENVHRGAVCVVRVLPHGSFEIAYQTGNIEQMIYIRSALKFIQVLPLLESGAADAFGFTDEEIAVMCASHEGEPFHLRAVQSILDKSGCQESELRCGGHPPCESSAFEYICQDSTQYPFSRHIYNNCSGKHAGFLALCKYLDVPTEGYLDPLHPVQVLIQEAACDIFGIIRSELHIGVDGCSAPAFAMPVKNAALGFARLCQVDLLANESRKQAINRMIAAMTKHPEMIWGTGGFDSLLLEASGGKVIGKRGAAGVHLSGIVGEGLGCAVKIDDGTMGPQYNVIMNFLQWSRFFDSEENKDKKERFYKQMSDFLSTPSKNYMGILVGSLSVAPGVLEIDSHDASVPA